MSLPTAAFAVKTPDQATNESVSLSLDATSFSSSFDGCWWNVYGLIYAFLPEIWEEQELTDDDMDLGCFAKFYDPDSDRSVLFSLTYLDGLYDDAIEYAVSFYPANDDNFTDSIFDIIRTLTAVSDVSTDDIANTGVLLCLRESSHANFIHMVELL